MARRFGELIRTARVSKKLTVRKLAQFAALSPGQLSEMENCRRLPPKDERKIEDLATLLDIPVDTLIDSAVLERKINSSGFMSRLFAVEPSLALGFCRVQDEGDDENFLEELKKLIGQHNTCEEV